ncbi:hypothetical protein B9Z19DRAFT_1080657 [Tuber borchii]|uniref:Uncharacterized protein n=1 Tax=Tuber borchii TaxID=42251 RepID=A0A2T6ZWT6_TUBBO|nr:hypothetical protein B9Z19DRAFT_1080657 [Tuber borchii]
MIGYTSVCIAFHVVLKWRLFPHWCRVLWWQANLCWWAAAVLSLLPLLPPSPPNSRPNPYSGHYNNPHNLRPFVIFSTNKLRRHPHHLSRYLHLPYQSIQLRFISPF